jgi:transmembrane sensor
MPTTRLTILFDRYLNNSCTPAEKQELAELIMSKEYDASISQVLEQVWAKTTGEADMTDEKVEHIFHSILTSETKTVPRVHRIHFRRLRWWAAAAIFILFVTGSYFLFFNNKSKQEEIVNTEPAKDVKAPETNRAMITLADGQTVFLDSAMNGQLAVQGNIKLVKLGNGQIAYQTASGEIIKELQYNTLNNPRGSKVIDMQLSDGSHVWLNAGSSVTFPIAFVGNERKVSVTGEAYFEISHDKTKPFIVSANNKADVTVLGTHFNVNAYDDEATLKVTLLEGSISVNNTIIKPGQQAQVSSDIKVVNNVDLAEVMAWKNGNFKFTRTDLKVIMREIGRWYDVEVSYEGNIPVQLYNVGVPRTANVSEVLRGLEFTGAHFSVEGKKIIVRP